MTSEEGGDPPCWAHLFDDDPTTVDGRTGCVIVALGDALRLQVDVIHRLRLEDLAVTSRCDGWTVRKVLNHSVAVTAKFTEFASGATDEPRTPGRDLLGEDHAAAVALVTGNAARAWQGADMSRMCRLPFGVFSAKEAAGINLLDALAHTWDIAAVTSIDLNESSHLWAVGLEAATAVIGAERDTAHYAAEVEVGPAASPMQRFLGYLGRHPGD